MINLTQDPLFFNWHTVSQPITHHIRESYAMEYYTGGGTKIPSRIHRKILEFAQRLKWTLKEQLIPAKQLCQATFFIYSFDIWLSRMKPLFQFFSVLLFLFQSKGCYTPYTAPHKPLNAAKRSAKLWALVHNMLTYWPEARNGRSDPSRPPSKNKTNT